MYLFIDRKYGISQKAILVICGFIYVYGNDIVVLVYDVSKKISMAMRQFSVLQYLKY